VAAGRCPMVNNFDYMFIRFDRIHERYGLTQTA